MLDASTPANWSLRRSRNRTQRLVAWLALTFVVLPAVVVPAVGTASAQPVSLECYIPTHQGFFTVIYTYIFNQQAAVCTDTFVFADAMSVTFINFQPTRTVVFSTVQPGVNGQPTLYSNTTVIATGAAPTTFSVELPSANPQRTVLACIDGGCLRFTHTTPLTFFPVTWLDVGGLDVLILFVVILTALLIFPLTLVARYLGKKAQWTPAWKAWLWAPHVIAFFLLGVAVDFQAFDLFFSGSEFLLFPVVFSFMYFLWSIHLFNTAKVAFAFRPEPHGFHHLSFEGWRFFIGRLPDGAYVLIGRRWRDWLARLFGHHAILSPAEAEYTTQGGPYSFPVQMRKAGFRRRPGRDNPLDDFRVEGPLDIRWRDPPSRLYFVDHDVKLNDAMPRLVWHTMVDVPAKLDKDGTVVIPPHKVEKRSKPHWIDPTPNAIGLAGIHMVDTIAAATNFISYEELTRRSEEKDVQIGRLTATLYRMADDMAARRVADMVRYYERDTMPLSDDERRQDSKPILSKVVGKDTEPGTGTDERPKAPPVAKARPDL